MAPIAIGGVGRTYAIYRLTRFALHGPIWHRVVAVVLIAVLLGINVMTSRQRRGPRR
jgi:hypothetical protein